MIADQIRLIELKKEQAQWEKVIRQDDALGSSTIQQQQAALHSE